MAIADQPPDRPTRPKTLKALSISKAVAASISDELFHGRVLSCFTAACNLTDETNRVVSLVTTEVGYGPLNVVVESQDPFVGIKAGLKATVERHKVAIGERLAVDLKDAVVWDAVVSWGKIAAQAMAVLWDHLQEQATSESLLAFWVAAVRPLSGVGMAFHEMARDAAERLLLALRRGERHSIAIYTSKLAGLGPGATPAGDDFLAGLMAGLRAWPRFLAPCGLPIDDACASIGQAAILRTRVFSGAHVRAAQVGQMSAHWHRLAAALAAADETAIRDAANNLLSFGATSGADALAGFVGPYLLADSDKT